MIYAFTQRAAMDVLMATAKNSGISFEAYQSQIEGVLSDVYAEGVFLSASQPVVGTQPNDDAGLLGMNGQSALAYLLACCRRRGIIEFFVKGPITRLVSALYASGHSFVAGQGSFRNSLGG